MRKKLRILGMRSSDCAVMLEDALRKTAGVSQAQVDLDAGLAEVVFDGSEMDEGELRRTVETCGFDVVGEISKAD